MIVVSDYRGFRIEVDAIADEGRYNAEVRIRRLFSQDKPHVDTVTCLKMTPDLAEHGGEIWSAPVDRSQGEGGRVMAEPTTEISMR